MAERVTVGVTGAAGYIGSALVTRLLETGHEVVAVDNFRDPKVESVGGHPIEAVDVRDRPALRAAFDAVDAVVHLAAVTGVQDCDSNPEEAFDVNVAGTANVAWCCREWGTPLVFPASMAVVGDPVEFPISADHPRAPLNLYGRTKQMSEADIHALAEGEFPALVLMKSNLYGHHVVGDETIGKRTVINVFVEQALDGGPLTVHEPGTQSRDFVHVLDIVRAYECALDALLDAPAGAQTVPIGSGDCRSVRDIAETVQRVVADERGDLIEIERVPNPRAAETVAADFTVDTETASAVIGFDAEFTIEGSIREMIRA